MRSLGGAEVAPVSDKERCGFGGRWRLFDDDVDILQLC